MSARIAVLASGGGSNLGALLQHLERPLAPTRARVVLVASNRTSAGALQRARSRGIPAEVVGDDDALAEALARHEVDLVVLAGYLRLVSADLTRRYSGRMLNIHPALLPSFGGPGMYGLRIHRAVIDSGAKVTGVTVHFVDERYDNGPVIAQWPVPVLAADTPEDVATRVLRVEHLVLPRVVEGVASGRIVLEAGGRVRGTFGLDTPDAEFVLRLSAGTVLADDIEAVLSR